MTVGTEIPVPLGCSLHPLGSAPLGSLIDPVYHMNIVSLWVKKQGWLGSMEFREIAGVGRGLQGGRPPGQAGPEDGCCPQHCALALQYGVWVLFLMLPSQHHLATSEVFHRRCDP